VKTMELEVRTAENSHPSRGGTMGINETHPEIIAIRALDFLAGDDEAFWRFLNLTGLVMDDNKDRISDPNFLGAVLDFLLEDERLVVAFAREKGLAPEIPMAARRYLPGMTTGLA
jgi:hypothetical protein